jgi:hypothetical protein
MRELEERRKADSRPFVAAFNNPSQAVKTRWMVGAPDHEGVVKATIRALLSPKELLDGKDWSFRTPRDIIAFEGKWKSGEQVALVIAEVENVIGEFKGTVSDLVSYQAPLKVAVFYQDSLTPEKLQTRETEIRGVLSYQFGKGFREARDTEYLIVFGPATVSEEGIGAWRGIWFTSDWQKSAFL